MQQPKWKSNDQFITLNLIYDLAGLYDVLSKACLSLIKGNWRLIVWTCTWRRGAPVWQFCCLSEHAQHTHTNTHTHTLGNMQLAGYNLGHSSADGTQTHRAETSHAPASQRQSGSASNSSATKRLQPSRTNSPFTRAEREAGRRWHRWVSRFVGARCHGIIVGTASPSDEPLVNFHMPVSDTRYSILLYSIPIVSPQEQISRQPDSFSIAWVFSSNTISE